MLTVKRDGIPESGRRLADGRIHTRLLSLGAYKNAETILCYIASRSEPETRPIIEDALASGKRVACPRCTDSAGHMDFRYISGFSQLVPGRFGLLEPDPVLCPVYDRRGDIAGDAGAGAGRGIPDKRDTQNNILCIVPGLSFDLAGGRLGYGKGYYDRFLAEFAGISAGICYEMMLSEELPRGEHDRNVDIIVTEERVLYNI